MGEAFARDITCTRTKNKETLLIHNQELINSILFNIDKFRQSELEIKKNFNNFSRLVDGKKVSYEDEGIGNLLGNVEKLFRSIAETNWTLINNQQKSQIGDALENIQEEEISFPNFYREIKQEIGEIPEDFTTDIPLDRPTSSTPSVDSETQRSTCYKKYSKTTVRKIRRKKRRNTCWIRQKKRKVRCVDYSSIKTNYSSLKTNVADVISEYYAADQPTYDILEQIDEALAIETVSQVIQRCPSSLETDRPRHLLVNKKIKHGNYRKRQSRGTYRKNQTSGNCTICGKWFQRITSHLVFGHNGKDKVSCPICKSSLHRGSLAKHYGRFHTTVKEIVCNYCRTPFSPASIFYHIYARHGKHDLDVK